MPCCQVGPGIARLALPPGLGDGGGMQWPRTSATILCVCLLSCSDGPSDADAGDEVGNTGDEPGDGDSESAEESESTGESESTNGDVCDPAGFVGGGIAEDGWGVGDFCDEIYLCVSNVDYEALVDLVEIPERNCVSDLLCGDGQRCTLSYGAVVDQQLYDRVCSALTIVDTVWCVVEGP